MTKRRPVRGSGGKRGKAKSRGKDRSSDDDADLEYDDAAMDALVGDAPGANL